MAVLKAGEVEGWVRRAPQDTPVVLIFVPDRGLVSERAAAYAGKLGLPLDDPFTVVRLEAQEADETGRLIDEARTVSMFAERRLIWVRNAAGQKRLADDVKALCDTPPEATIVLIEAGDIKKGVGLRGVVEGSRNAVGLPCYQDSDRDLDGLIDRELAQAGIGIDMAARSLLRQQLGGDRLATRSELQKLALYASGEPAITIKHIAELSGDVSETSIGDVVDAVLSGDIGAFDRDFQRFVSAGGQPFLILNATMRELHTLRQMRSEVEFNRKQPAQLIEAARPPIHFARKVKMQAALGAWQLSAIDRALGRIQACVLETRRNDKLAETLAHRLLMALTAEAARNSRRRAG